MNTPNAVRPARATSTLAMVSLGFGIAAWMVIPFIGAIVAIICGHMARSEIRRSEAGELDGDGMAIVGLILGYAQLVAGLFGLAVLGMIVFGILQWGHP